MPRIGCACKPVQRVIVGSRRNVSLRDRVGSRRRDTAEVRGITHVRPCGVRGTAVAAGAGA
ncbi:unnamed protein product, partial [marine sediment metagenome]